MSVFKHSVAAREKVKLMLGLTGPSGSGKTYSALQLAHGITGDWSKIALADTENKSALYYAGDISGPWAHMDFPATLPRGYHPENWIALLDYVEAQKKFDVLILDSITHEWEGAGGCLELVDELSSGGNKFSGGWKIVTPLHRAFIDRMRSSPLHVIATMRSKQDYVVETNDKGKAVPKKVGTKSVQREGTDYEFGIIFDLDMAHYASASKDRTGLFAKKTPFKITKDHGEQLLRWANSGVDAPPKKGETIYDASNHDHVEKLQEYLDKHKIDNKLHIPIENHLIGNPWGMLPKIIEEIRNGG